MELKQDKHARRVPSEELVVDMLAIPFSSTVMAGM